MARTMLDEQRTPRRFWANAISTACYISNRIFLRSILHLTPIELRFGRKPVISHLRPFGYAHHCARMISNEMSNTFARPC
jgi:hypothetical protein